MDEPEWGVADAERRLTSLHERAEGIHAQIDAVQKSTDHSAEYKQRQAAALREQLFTDLRETRVVVEHSLSASGARAESILGGMRAPTDPVEANAQLLAGTRVQTALQRLSPAAAAEVFAQSGDAAALRALHAALPVYVATTIDTKRQQPEPVVRALQESVERQLESLATPTEARAIRARRGIAEQQAKLEALVEYALHPESPYRQMAWGYATGAAR